MTAGPSQAVERRIDAASRAAGQRFGSRSSFRLPSPRSSIMTVAAAGVAITSFSATEHGVQGMANREVPLMTDALRLSVISGEISAAAAHFVSAKTADEQKAIAATIQERYRALTTTHGAPAPGAHEPGHSPRSRPPRSVSASTSRRSRAAIAERSALRGQPRGEARRRAQVARADRRQAQSDRRRFLFRRRHDRRGRRQDRATRSSSRWSTTDCRLMQAIVDVGAETNLVDRPAHGRRAHVLGVDPDAAGGSFHVLHEPRTEAARQASRGAQVRQPQGAGRRAGQARRFQGCRPPARATRRGCRRCSARTKA